MLREVIIIGSGPAGYTAGIYTARAGLKPLILAGSVGFGGALMETTTVENYPGFPQGIDGPELMDNMQHQAERFGAEVLFEDAVEVDLGQEPGSIKTVKTDSETYTAKTVIIATGSAYRHLNVPGEEEFSAHGVSYCATCDGFFFKGKHIVVVGGGDTAMEEAIYLTRFGSKVSVIHRRDQLRASKAMQDKAFANSKIEFIWNSQVVQVLGESSVSSLVLQDTLTGEQRNLPAEAMFVAIGHEPRTALFEGKLQLTDSGNIWVNEPSTQTSVPGVFACGDVVDETYRQAVSAAGSGCKAAKDVERYLESI